MAVLKGSNEEYSVLQKCRQLLQTAILDNLNMHPLLPAETKKYAERITFTGRDKPSIPVNWRFAESISVLKGLEGILTNALLTQKYHLEPQDVVVDVDHAQLFIVSCLLTRVLAPGQEDVDTKGFNTSSAIFPSCDIHRNSATPYRTCAGNLYRTKDERYFHLHSDLNPDVVLDALGLPHDVDGDYDAVYPLYEAKTTQHTAAELDSWASEQLRRPGTVAWSVNEYARSAHGRANANKGLWEITHHPFAAQNPGWWPSTPQTSPERPLAGLKIVDFSRIIAAPTATRGLDEYGASVMRVTAPHLPDMGFFLPDMGWGKWNCSLDLRREEDVAQAKALIADADVVVYGYRPNVLDQYDIGPEGALQLCENQDRGLIVLRLNCYGWTGPWKDRSGWQQISDACCGVSMEFGRAMHGSDEPVTPLFLNSDHCGGLAGHLGVLSALMARASEGGSFMVDCSLNGYSQWLTGQIGTYPKNVWDEVWALRGRPKFRHYLPMQFLFPKGIELLRKNTPHLMDERFFEEREASAMGCRIRCVKPVLSFPGEKVQLGFQVSARTNGVDRPMWPDNLLVDQIGAV